MAWDIIGIPEGRLGTSRSVEGLVLQIMFAIWSFSFLLAD
jgi:hypothetical protein